ncbi:MAG: DNA alkylation repair protein [Bacteroidetes bacterium]|nr:DNA alkylation repair protein [Bacteroidota bacterium]
MTEKLKDLFFTETSIDHFAGVLQKQYPRFDHQKFKKLIHDKTWPALELKAKMHHVTRCMHDCLPEDYIAALVILVKAAPDIKGFEGMVLPDYVEHYGMDHWEESLNALGHFTKYASSEFAIRPFLDQNPELVMKYMHIWAENENENVRRFASEGCRPRLPWAMVLPKFILDPRPILEVLEKLKNDPSEFVRKSVANNLNDISKDHPDIAMDTAVRWYGYSDQTNKIVKHGLRTLLKKGNPRALTLLGIAGTDDIKIKGLKTDRPFVKIGDTINFEFILVNKAKIPKKIRLEYIIQFAKARGKTSEKNFQISLKEFSKGAHTIKRRHSFRDLSTRKHYHGKHKLIIVANGERMKEISFNLK